jgi:hypothetical protein
VCGCSCVGWVGVEVLDGAVVFVQRSIPTRVEGRCLVGVGPYILESDSELGSSP